FFFPAGQEFRMVLWDNRPQSPTFNNKKVIKTGKENLFVSIPPGIVHGYKNTGTKDVFSFNFPDKLFAGQNKKEEIDEIRHEEDPEDAFLKDFDND
ncbi:MAG: dTDP-4-dehydrorhamnose 3,5-epimerase, partial [Fibrobacterota bacterium]